MAADNTVITSNGVNSMIVMSISSTVIAWDSISKCWSLSFVRYIVQGGGMPVSLAVPCDVQPRPDRSLPLPALHIGDILVYGQKRGGATGGGRRPREVVV